MCSGYHCNHSPEYFVATRPFSRTWAVGSPTLTTNKQLFRMNFGQSIFERRVKALARIVPLNQLGTFEIQVWLNKLATKYSQSVVRHCYINVRSIMQAAKKLKFLASDPAEDVNMPQTKPCREAGDDSGADPEAHRRHSGPP